jgi:histo-blood group ABO system transferase
VNIGLLVVATRGYVRFVPDLYGSALTYFFPDDDVTMHLFTDADAVIGVGVRTNRRRFAVERHQIPSYGWPDATLMRYREFYNALYRPGEPSQHDWLFYVDVDARFEKPVGLEILPVPGLAEHELVGLLHSGFGEGDGTWETRPESRAFVTPEMRRRYFMGGFNGGSWVAFLAASKVIADDIDRDKAAGITAIWHDESYLNQFFASVMPKILPRTFSAPEEAGDVGQAITFLLKDHNAIRSER